jgi:mannose-6-phosphate isomerase-like protein (cupin superfamily)
LAASQKQKRNARREQVETNRPWKLVTLPSHRTAGKPGLLVLSETPKVTDGLFDAAPRNYWIVNDTPEPTTRGKHYHPRGGKQEYLVCLHGRAVIELHSADGCDSVTLDRPDLALVIPSEVWHGVTLQPGAILLSTASTLYHPEEARTEKTCLLHE